MNPHLVIQLQYDFRSGGHCDPRFVSFCMSFRLLLLIVFIFSMSSLSLSQNVSVSGFHLVLQIQLQYAFLQYDFRKLMFPQVFSFRMISGTNTRSFSFSMISGPEATVILGYQLLYEFQVAITDCLVATKTRFSPTRCLTILFLILILCISS